MSTSLHNRELEYKQLKKRRRIEFTLGRKAQNASLHGAVSSKHLENSASQPMKVTCKDSLFDSSIVEKNLQWNKVQRVGPGFYNEGNTCFLNSTLQCLLYIPAFVQVLLSESTIETIRRLQKGESNMKPILELFTILAREVWQNQHGSAISPKGLVISIKRVGKQFKPFRQEDAHEYMRQLIDTMHEEILKSHHLKLSDGKITQTSMISRVFGGNLCNILSCPKCSYQSKTFNHFQDLSLDINKQGINSVDAAIKSFTTVEYLSQGNEWKCEKCKQKVKASKQMTIDDVPSTLVLHLKRFSFGNMFAKITKHIQFSPTLLLPQYDSESRSTKNITYDLCGVVVHHGYSTHSGHYIAYVKAPNGQWHEMDDQQVSVASLKTVLQCQAYILCYSKVCTTAPSSSSVNVVSNSNSTANKDTVDRVSISSKNSNNNNKTEVAKKPTTSLQPELSIVRAIVASAPKAPMDSSDDSSSETDDDNDPATTTTLTEKVDIVQSRNHLLRLISREGYIPTNPMRFKNSLQKFRKWVCSTRPEPLRSKIKILTNPVQDSTSPETPTGSSCPPQPILQPDTTAQPVADAAAAQEHSTASKEVMSTAVVLGQFDSKSSKPHFNSTLTGSNPQTKSNIDIVASLLEKSREGKNLGSVGVWETIGEKSVSNINQLATKQRRQDQQIRRQKRTTDWDAQLDAGRQKKLKKLKDPENDPMANQSKLFQQVSNERYLKKKN